MALESFVIFLMIGAIAGWLAGVIVKGYGYGLLGNIVVGAIGSFIGRWVLGYFGVFHGAGFTGTLICATLGAVILLFLIRLVRREERRVRIQSLAYELGEEPHARRGKARRDG